jgi:hypothetical protein
MLNWAYTTLSFPVTCKQLGRRPVFGPVLLSTKPPEVSDHGETCAAALMRSNQRVGVGFYFSDFSPFRRAYSGRTSAPWQSAQFFGVGL